ncbi:glutathione S-transferase family protein [Bordetella genomosp. 12]|uniref:GST N-terminal domain-containing protein n=1 Tax=Bordetella genomosp. 12 TaxID=463035 RepID=A0A261VBJ7_9BORD|nr:glutathione S-transferase family protein [Bordetella genomosp. 12]OZI70922.1 hypothetical protein CAL22_13565 [Bordetella genomosp. 12]
MQASTSPWRLRTSAASPFGRKVYMAIVAQGLEDRVTVIGADTADPGDALRRQNPLGKIPVLLVDGLPPLFDSRVIIEFLAGQNGTSTLIPAGAEKFIALRDQALADGVMDASVLMVYERRFRPEGFAVASWLDYQADKVERALAAFESEPPSLAESGPGIGAITLVAALLYLDLRFEGAWRTRHPGLQAWLEAFAARYPAVYAAKPQLS